jgi:acyl-coenzyme A thioesterase PaaI-like protein
MPSARSSPDNPDAARGGYDRLMDATPFAASLLESVPANASFGLQVVRAVDGLGEVAIPETPAFGNVIGALHSSGLIALIDAAALAAVISAADTPDQFDGVLPLGSVAQAEFLAPARGRIVASCDLPADDHAALAAFYAGHTNRIKLTTWADLLDPTGAVVCRGSFTWSIKSSRA